MARVYREVQQTRLSRADPVDGDEEPLAYGVNMIARVVYLVGGIIIALLGLRFLLALLGANPNNSFANFVYSASRPFAQPFFGLFNYKSQFGITRFEYETIIVIIFYALATWLIVRLLSIGDDY